MVHLHHPVLGVAGAVLQRRLDGPDLFGAAQVAVIVVHPATLALARVVTVTRTSERTSDRGPE